jgi:allophanate hydrolase subunit 1
LIEFNTRMVYLPLCMSMNYIIHVDDILIVYDHNKIKKEEIQNYLNNIHPELKFTGTEETNNTINYLDLTITRNQTKLDINIYREPTTTDTTIHYKSNHPTQHKLAAYRFMLNRLHNLPLSKEHKQQEMNTIFHIAQHNGTH